MKVIEPGVAEVLRVILGPHWRSSAIFDPILGPLRGRIGADVWSHNKGGDYVRLGTTPTNPNTSRQQTTRSLLGTYAAFWTTALTQAQRDAWEVYASTHPILNSLGQSIYITGLAWVCKCNTRLGDAGAAVLTDPPQSQAPAALNTLSVDMSAVTTIDVTFTPAIGAAERLQLWVSLPESLGSTPNIRQCRLAGYSPAAQASPWAATTPHSFQSGDRVVAFCARMSDEGLMSAYMQAIDDTDF